MMPFVQGLNCRRICLMCLFGLGGTPQLWNVTDIKETYLQVEIEDRDGLYFRLLWRELDSIKVNLMPMSSVEQCYCLVKSLHQWRLRLALKRIQFLFIYLFIQLLFYLFCNTTNMMKTIKKNRFNNGEDYQKETMKLILLGLLSYCFTR